MTVTSTHDQVAGPQAAGSDATPRSRAITIDTGGDRAAQRSAASRHSRRVRLLRIALPAIGGLIFLGFVGYSYLTDLGAGVEIGSISLGREGVIMNNPRLSGHDGRNRSYEVTAKRAIQRIDDPKKIELQELTARIDLKGQDWATFTADRGYYDGNAETLRLEQGIVVESGSGYKARLDHAKIDLKNGELMTDRAIDVTSPAGSVRADSMEVRQNGDVIVFQGSVKMTIIPSKLKGDQ